MLVSSSVVCIQRLPPWLRNLSLLMVCMLLWIPVSLGASQEHESSKTTKNIAISGYLPDYRSIDLNHTVSYLSDLILFSLEVHPRGMVGGCCLQKDHYERARIAQQYHNRDVKLWVTVGGQGRANGWQEICKDPTKQTRFIESMIRLWCVQ